MATDQGIFRPGCIKDRLLWECQTHTGTHREDVLLSGNETVICLFKLAMVFASRQQGSAVCLS